MRRSLVKNFGKIISVVLLVFAVSWAVNFYKFLNCDFKSGDGYDYRCEVFHALGLIPVVSLIVVWTGDDNE